MNGLALCAGACGIELGIKLAEQSHHRTVCYVEAESYPAAIIQARIRDGLLDDAPIWDDLRTFAGGPWRGVVDLVTSGFPCQGWSFAGKRRGADDPRNLWPDVARVVREVQPAICFFENVPGILPYHFAEIKPRLSSMGFRVVEGIYAAAEVGAPHLRPRLFILAYAIGTPRPSIEQEREALAGGLPPRDGAQGAVAHAEGEPIRARLCEERQASIRRRRSDNGRSAPSNSYSARLAQREGSEEKGEPGSTFDGSDWWSVEPDVGRVADGVAARVDRLRACGNGAVPAVAVLAWRGLWRKLA